MPKRYIFALVPFIGFSLFALWHYYMVQTGRVVDGYFHFTEYELDQMAPTLFWMGVVFSSTLIAIVIVSDVFDYLQRKLTRDIYDDRNN